MAKSSDKAKPADESHAALAKSAGGAESPLYLVDGGKRIAFANAALAQWVGLSIDQVVGRLVEYHSEPPDPEQSGALRGDAAGLLTGLCPLPQALVGVRCQGSVSCQDLGGKLRRRRADFLPLPQTDATTGPVLVLVGSTDLAAGEPEAEPDTAQRLHAELVRLRQADPAGRLSPALIGDTAPTRLLRSQTEAAVASGANVLVRGELGDDPAGLARAIFNRSAGAASRLASIDAGLLPGEATLEQVDRATRATQLPTLLIERVDELADSEQRLLAARLASTPGVRVLATAAPAARLEPELATQIAVVELLVRPLGDRAAELPLLCQWAVESANRGSPRQVAGCTSDALDMLSLHPWDGGLEQLRQAIADAHAGCDGPVIAAEHLPASVRQACLSAELPDPGAEAVVLDELLAGLEHELVVRALERSRNNKAEAARMLGMTRPRFYRRLARLGLLPRETEAKGAADDPDALDDNVDNDNADEERE